jgi:hypothetical protein
MSVLNEFVARLLDTILYPFRDRPPLVGILVVSLLTAVAMLVVVRTTSDQARLTAVRRSMYACLFEIRLFNDDLSAMMRALREMLRHDLRYLRLSLAPALWLIAPLALLVSQLNFHYSYTGLEIGSPALVKVRVQQLAEAPILEAPPGIRIETPGVGIPSLGETVWRIAAERPGDYELQVHVGAASFTKTVRVSGAIVRRSPLRVENRLLDQLLYPAEPPLPAGAPVQSIAVTYPRRGVSVLGRETHWMIVFFVLSMMFAIGLKRRFNVVL